MIPIGGLSFLVHLLINASVALVRLLRLEFNQARLGWFPAPLFPVVIATCITSGVVFAVDEASRGDTNIDHVRFALHQCEVLPVPPSGNQVVVRIDDIQAYAWTDISRRLIRDTLQRGIAPSLAVIPKGLAEDRSFYRFLRSNRCDVEFALHGWDNQEPQPGRGEFGVLGFREAKKRIEAGLEALEGITHRKVVTFVPPNNELSREAYRALQASDFSIVSSEGDHSYGYDATTFDYFARKPIPGQEAAQACLKAVNSEGLCVFMIHPQDFADATGSLDERAYREYLIALDTLLAAGVEFVRFEEIGAFSPALPSEENSNIEFTN